MNSFRTNTRTGTRRTRNNNFVFCLSQHLKEWRHDVATSMVSCQHNKFCVFSLYTIDINAPATFYDLFSVYIVFCSKFDPLHFTGKGRNIRLIFFLQPPCKLKCPVYCIVSPSHTDSSDPCIVSPSHTWTTHGVHVPLHGLPTL